MYSVWGIESVPEGHMVIRVEFQLRREAIRSLGADTWSDFQSLVDNMWAYCTQKWLRFADNPEREHKYRVTLPWWEVVQSNFLGIAEACPAVRAEAVTADRYRLLCAMRGLMSSYMALHYQCVQDKVPAIFRMSQVWLLMGGSLDKLEADKGSFGEDVRGKMAKYIRRFAKHREAREERKRLGLTPGSGEEGAG